MKIVIHERARKWTGGRTSRYVDGLWCMQMEGWIGGNVVPEDEWVEMWKKGELERQRNWSLNKRMWTFCLNHFSSHQNFHLNNHAPTRGHFTCVKKTWTTVFIWTQPCNSADSICINILLQLSRVKKNQKSKTWTGIPRRGQGQQILLY